ncbi:MAG: hypothetical protein M1831_002442 [Alyxoria varia]|nr:MAG: hypothetical protein M1831_002442 [Alyxoria varia]
MESNQAERTDDSPIRPVSSLRARFESTESPARDAPPNTKPKPPVPISSKPSAHTTGSQSENPTQSSGGGAVVSDTIEPSRPVTLTKNAPRLPAKPTSHEGVHPRPPPPRVRVNESSPKSPTRSPKRLAIPHALPIHASEHGSITPAGVLTENPLAPPPIKQNKTGTLYNSVVEPPRSPTYQALDLPDHGAAPGTSRHVRPYSAQNPPPINRAAKPGTVGRDVDLTVKTQSLSVNKDDGNKTSPFSTPPSSNDDSPERNIGSQVWGGRSHYELPQGRSSSPRPNVNVEHTRQRSVQAPAPHPPRTISLEHRKVDPVQDDLEPRPKPPQPPPPRISHAAGGSRPTSILARSSLDVPRPFRQNGPIEPPARANSHPPPTTSPSQTNVPRKLPHTPSPRSSAEATRSSHISSQPAPSLQSDGPGTSNPSNTLEFPNSSQASRRPPVFSIGPQWIPTGFDCRLMDVCGELVCTTGTLTKVWNSLTGKLVLSMTHAETVKITALAFKPARKVEEEGLRLWLGTNHGEIQEIDLESRTVVASNSHAHARREVTRIFRHAAEMWSLDEEGKLFVWPTDSTGSPNLEKDLYNGRIPKGHSASVIVGNQFWVASGRDVRVFRPNTDPTRIPFQVTKQSISPSNLADITTVAIIPNDTDKVYFGHSDGKITTYSRRDFSCLGTASISLYKINCLAGVGDYLWAGFNTGVIMAYDTRVRPWKAKKYWLAHSNPVIKILLDPSSIWKFDRLQVVSLGVDNAICLWDGLAQDDWIDDEMQLHEGEYSKYKELTALIMTWNAGASKPMDLRHDQKDSNFFRDLLQAQHPLDILVFGLQELVDLEDKKLTAKSFFKKKKEDTYGQEHLSRAYRAWRDHLTRCIDEHLANADPYALLHSASLVGLFTCVFVKASLRPRIREVYATEVKTGMGGLHGNKGALVVRFILDDTSVCFVNCHLAAGQAQTVNRNQDVASILESATLAPARALQESLVSGGDGSLAMDHEICFLNGDLNYRIDTMSRDTVVHAIKAKNLNKLLDRDQLLLSRRKNPGFRLRDFIEAPITFWPTYKYDVGTDNYDSSDKKRAPAWCDRILYRGEGGLAGPKVKQLSYCRHEVRVSDHRPVSATFQVRPKTIDPARHRQIREWCGQRFDAMKGELKKDAGLRYLVEVFGLSEAEANQYLAS